MSLADVPTVIFGMKMNIPEIQKQIIDKFFGETFKRHSDNITAILSCSSLEKLIQARRALSQEDIDTIFQNCTAKDMLSARFSARECKGVFLRLKTVSLNSDFI
jgi:hypothetical protein